MGILKHTLACAGALLLAPALAAPIYSVMALPVGTNPLGINNAGQIVGDVFCEDNRRGFVWTGADYTVLGTLGGSNSTAHAINGHGVIAGYAALGGGDSHAFRYHGSGLTDLKVFGVANSVGVAINDSGQIAGQYVDRLGGYRAYLHSGGSDTDLGTLGGGFAYAADINNAGQVVGVSAVDDSSPFLAHAFLYTNGTMTDLGTLGGSYSMAAAINDAGQVVGNAWVAGNEHAFLYDGGRMRDLGTLGGRRSFAYGINAAGLIVGNANDISDTGYYGFIYQDGAMINLNSLIDPASGWTVLNAIGINDNNQIAAYGCQSDGACGGLLLQLAPVPEPHTWAMLLAGVALLARRARSRVG